MRYRPYQQELDDRAHAAWAAGARNVLLVSPTGGGKTVVGSGIIKKNRGASCAIAHRQELVSQISLAFARNEIRHNIIGPKNVVRMINRLHMDELGKSYFNPSSPCAVAGVDTLVRRSDELAHWLGSVSLWWQDECFPAGTLVDGVPIETLQPSDEVTAFNEHTGGFEKRRVVRLFKNLAPKHMMRLDISGHHVLHATKGHPFWTRRGWVEAGKLNESDEVLLYGMFNMRGGSEPGKSDNGLLPKDRAAILQPKMFDGLPESEVVGGYGGNESEICLGAYEEKQPHAVRRDSGESFGNIKEDRTRPETTRGERPHKPSRGRSAFATLWARLFRSSGDKDNSTKRQRISALVQSGRGKRGAETGDRGGRKQSRIVSPESSGQKERRATRWARLDSVTLQEFRDIRNADGGTLDGFVYNIEVEGLHTYIADGVVVHNCHHVLRSNKWGSAADMFPNARGLGVTATPTRADGKGLGRHADGLFDEMVIVDGADMRGLINQGYLTDYRIYAPPSDLDLSSVSISAGGDYNKPKLKAAVRKSHIIGDVVTHYLRIAPGKLGITFVPDVETATDTAAEFNAAGVPAAVVSAETPADQRASILRRFKNRELMQLVNVDLFGEGFDLPAIEVVSMARPTQSYALFVQQFGRALRLMISAILSGAWDTYSDAQRRSMIADSSKPYAIIIDHVGNVERHGLPDAPKQWTLDRRERTSKAKPSDAIPVRSCPMCTSVYERIYNACPHCGHSPIPAARSGPEFVDGDLVELDAETLARMRGESVNLEQTPASYLAESGAGRLPHIAAMASARRFTEKQDAQRTLREAIAWWAGWQRSQSRPDSESYRRFYFRFGIDVLSAQALNRAESEALRERVESHLVANKINC